MRETLRAGSSGTWDGQHLWYQYPCAWGSKQSIEDQTTTPKTKSAQIKRWNKNCRESAKEKRFKTESIAISEVTLNHATHLLLSKVSPFFLWWEKPPRLSTCNTRLSISNTARAFHFRLNFELLGSSQCLHTDNSSGYDVAFLVWSPNTGSNLMALEMHLCHVFKFLDH